MLAAEVANRLAPQVILSEYPGHACILIPGNMNRFESKLDEHRLLLRRGRLQTLHINAGRKCNQTCAHCLACAAGCGSSCAGAVTGAKSSSSSMYG